MRNKEGKDSFGMQRLTKKRSIRLSYQLCIKNYKNR